MRALQGETVVRAVGERIQARLADRGVTTAGAFSLPLSVQAITPLAWDILVSSENASRLAAMRRVGKNIATLLDTFNGDFRRLRQNDIDEELFDVITAFEALKKGRWVIRHSALTSPPRVPRSLSVRKAPVCWLFPAHAGWHRRAPAR